MQKFCHLFFFLNMYFHSTFPLELALMCVCVCVCVCVYNLNNLQITFHISRLQKFYVN